MQNVVATIQSFVLGLPEPVQFLGVAVAGLIPFIESYGASTIGIAAGVPIPLAVTAGIFGNVASVLLVVYGISGIRGRVTARRAVTAGAGADPAATSTNRGAGKQSRVVENIRRFGVPGASLLGPLVLPTQLTSAAMVGAGANRTVVAVWTSIAAALWGLAIGLGAAGLFSATGVI